MGYHPQRVLFQQIYTNCNKIFPRKPYFIKTINFCSRTCYDESRSKPVNVRCFSCNKLIKRLPRELHERNFCSTQCQANAPKITKKCAVCNKDVTRRITQTFQNKTGNFYCSRDCYFISTSNERRNNGVNVQVTIHHTPY